MTHYYDSSVPWSTVLWSTSMTHLCYDLYREPWSISIYSWPAMTYIHSYVTTALTGQHTTTRTATQETHRETDISFHVFHYRRVSYTTSATELQSRASIHYYIDRILSNGVCIVIINYSDYQYYLTLFSARTTELITRGDLPLGRWGTRLTRPAAGRPRRCSIFLEIEISYLLTLTIDTLAIYYPYYFSVVYGRTGSARFNNHCIV